MLCPMNRLISSGGIPAPAPGAGVTRTGRTTRPDCPVTPASPPYRARTADWAIPHPYLARTVPVR